MEKEYLNCKNGLTPLCPNHDDPFMKKLLMKPIENNTVDYFIEKTINDANSLCAECDSFIPFQEQ